ncbi:MAG: GNAT family N-acetyltransferase [Gemmatimonadaceae bacterium]
MTREALGGRQVRPLAPSDRPLVAALFASEPQFRDAEAAVAVELFHLGIGDGTAPPADPDYRWLGVEQHGVLAGCACYGPTPGTDGTFDLYWIAVAPASQGRGLGRLLISHVEHAVARDGGRLVVIETSGSDAYVGTRAFYLSCGYALLATIHDFYAPGEHRLIFGALVADLPLAAEPARALG